MRAAALVWLVIAAVVTTCAARCSVCGGEGLRKARARLCAVGAAHFSPAGSCGAITAAEEDGVQQTDVATAAAQLGQEIRRPMAAPVTMTKRPSNLSQKAPT